MSRPFRRVWSRIAVVVGAAIPPERVRAGTLRARVAALGDLDAEGDDGTATPVEEGTAGSSAPSSGE
jgi:hypothetical protein